MKARLCLAFALVTLAAGAAGAQDVQVTFSNPALRVFQSYTLKAGDTAQSVLVIANDATIEGHVEGDVLVVLGRAQLTSTAVVDGSFIIAGGNGVIAEGAQVHRDVVAVGGLEAPPGFNPGGSQVVIGTVPIGDQLRGFVPWLTRGLLLGRLIVPDLGWVWAVAAVFFLVNLLLNLLFDGPVRAAAAALRSTPLSAFATGLLIMLLAGPLCALLAVSVIGIVVVPFLLAALVLGTIIGRIAFARWIGSAVVNQTDFESRSQSLRSFVVGSAIMAIAYMIPVLGLLMWALAAVFALGGATQAFVRAYRRENPRPSRKARSAAAATAAAAAAAPNPVASNTASIVEPIAPEPPPSIEPSPLDTAPSIVEPSTLEPPPAPETPAAAPAVTRGLLALPRATFVERLAALFLDLVLVAMIAQVVRLDRLFWMFPAGENNLLLIAIAYHVAFWTWKQTTIGGMICQLRLVRTDGGAIRFAEALVRGLVGILSLVVAGLGFLWIIWDPERQSWHDRVAGTYVVKVPRDWPM
jgi:uncharacterized RDD family membrane protein YckC